MPGANAGKSIIYTHNAIINAIIFTFLFSQAVCEVLLCVTSGCAEGSMDGCSVWTVVPCHLSHLMKDDTDGGPAIVLHSVFQLPRTLGIAGMATVGDLDLDCLHDDAVVVA